jgi:hypothetical protein
MNRSARQEREDFLVFLAAIAIFAVDEPEFEAQMLSVGRESTRETGK